MTQTQTLPNDTVTTAITVGANPRMLPSEVMLWWDNEDLYNAVRLQICPDATDAEMAIFVAQCRLTGLNPIARQIYLVKRKQWNASTRSYIEKAVTQVSIDGFRLIAERSHEYQGQVGPFYCSEDGQWTDVWLKPEPPAAAKVGVRRAGWPEPLFAVALFKSYVQTNSQGEPISVWKTNPAAMISKCAEALALRRAFPQELSGLYTTEEMGQADNPQLPAKAASQPAAKVTKAKDPNARPYAPDILTTKFNQAVAAIEQRGLMLGPDDYRIVQETLKTLSIDAADLPRYLEYVSGMAQLEDMSESHVVALLRMLKPTQADGVWAACPEANAEAADVIKYLAERPVDGEFRAE